jgi:hypothetical protein
MFNKDFYPTPKHVLDIMLEGEDVENKICFDPEGGKGDIVDYFKNNGAKDVISCEINADLRKILQTKCKIIASDFFDVESSQVSHIDYIFMNPPFSEDEKHILHAWEIAPPGCKIKALCNLSTIDNIRTADRKRLKQIIEENGESKDLGECFSDSERKTNVEVALISITKPGNNYDQEFEGFFMDDDPAEIQENGIMSYNVIRDIVNRYVSAVKLFDQQLETGVNMESLIGCITPKYTKDDGALAFTATRNGMPLMRHEFKKNLQKRSWLYIFEKMNLGKYSTKGLKEDINKFVEHQTNIPFTMRNIYKMLEIVIGTTGQRMDKALMEVFDKLTEMHHDNRFGVEGWKTNSHFLLNKKFILDYICYQDQRWYKGESKLQMNSNSNSDIMDDFVKALCYITGDNYDNYDRLYSCAVDDKTYGQWFNWAYFRCKGFKKGSMHFEFKDDGILAKFNQHIARIKGYPLFEGKEQTAYQDRQTGRGKKKAA